MATEKAIELAKKLGMINLILEGGEKPFVAMSVVLDEADWLLVYAAFAKLVRDANGN